MDYKNALKIHLQWKIMEIKLIDPAWMLRKCFKGGLYTFNKFN